MPYTTLCSPITWAVCGKIPEYLASIAFFYKLGLSSILLLWQQEDSRLHG